MITRGEVDIGLAAFYLTEDRAKIVDLSVVFDQAEWENKKWNVAVSANNFRNKFFIASPGRDLGGFLSFIQGFRLSAWLASLVFLITMPLVFFITYKILLFFELKEVTEWTVGWNLFAVTGAIVQQVCQRQQIRITSYFVLLFILRNSLYYIYLYRVQSLSLATWAQG